jgi:hypothetical protein
MDAKSINMALQWLVNNSVKLPRDLQSVLESKNIDIPKSIKQAADIFAISQEYKISIQELLTAYFEGEGSVVAPRNKFRQLTNETFTDVFYLGWAESGQELPIDPDALDWLNARTNQEFGFIDMLIQEAKELRKEEDFDYASWIMNRSEGYANTLKEIYNNSKIRGLKQEKDIMVTFDGDDGKKSCDDCLRYKGQRHKISWFMRRNAIPPHGSGLACSKGGKCKHGLRDDSGNWITV